MLWIEYVSRNNVAHGKAPLTMQDVLEGMVKAYEIQGVLSLENSFNRVGLDHGTLPFPKIMVPELIVS